MADEPRTLVMFESSTLNNTEVRDYFINDCCFGDDVLIWVARRLRERGHVAEQTPGQEDFGWYLYYRVNGVDHMLVLSYRPGDEAMPGVWLGWVRRRRGLFGIIFGREAHGITGEAVRAVHEALSGAPEISNLHWHFERDFGLGREDLGAAEPF